MIELGDKVRDTITGFTGIAVLLSQHLNGCVQVGIEGANTDPQKNGKPLFDLFDIQRVEILETGAYKPQNHGVNPPGGPADSRIVRPDDSYRR